LTVSFRAMVHSIRGLGKRNEHTYESEMESSASAIQFSRGIGATNLTILEEKSRNLRLAKEQSVLSLLIAAKSGA
jgi:hypothetical protein